MSDNQIYIIGINEGETNAKGIVKGAEIICQAVNIEDLNRNLLSFLNCIDSVFSDIDSSIKEIQVKDITLNVSISASGKISLIGSAEAGIKGGITIRLQKK